MPTYREDLHTGHKVPLVETDDIIDGGITHNKLADDSVETNNIKDRAVTEPKLGDESVSTRTIQPGAVTTPKIGDGSVTPEKLNERVVPEVIKPLIDALEGKHDADVTALRAKDADLQNQIDSLEVAGVAVSNMFGDDKHISVSQWALTRAISKIYQILGDITGTIYQGINLTVSPDYYIGEDGCTVHITANTVEANGIFERLKFYWNDEQTPFAEAENVEFFEFDSEISETAILRVEAQILGVTYTDQKIITHYSSYWLGAGADYQDVMVNANLKPVTHHLRAAYDVTVNEGDHIIVVLGSSLAHEFIRADINGMEIAMAETIATVDDNVYKVFVSEEEFAAGTYNIDING